MATLIRFAPSSAAPFSFQPTLDGAVYNASVPWLFFGRRYYLSLVSVTGAQIWFGALVGSPDGLTISALSWANGVVSVRTGAPHGLRIASTVQLSVVGCAPAAYAGAFQCLVTGPQSLSYPLASNPGPATVLGVVQYDVNLIGGVPNADGVPFSSTLVFRASSQQFEVTP